MRIVYDPAKRARILAERSLDVADAGELFDAFHLTRSDDTHSSDEDRYVSVGVLKEVVVIVVWTARGTDRRIVTMWKANEKERNAYCRQRDRPG